MNKLSVISILTMNCHEASQLASAELERELAFRERWALKLHSLVCSVCSGFAQQINLIHQAAAQMPTQLRDELFTGTLHLSPSRRAEIKRLLDEAASLEH